MLNVFIIGLNPKPSIELVRRTRNSVTAAIAVWLSLRPPSQHGKHEGREFTMRELIHPRAANCPVVIAGAGFGAGTDQLAIDY